MDGFTLCTLNCNGIRAADRKGFSRWLAGEALPLDLESHQLTELLDQLAEYGKALDGYRGGVWQSIKIDGAQVSTIRSLGGFLNLMYTPEPKWRFVAGVGVDDPKDEDFLGQQGRYRNSTIFANAMYSLYPGGWIGLEIDRMDTDYRDNSAHNNRIQLAIIQKF